MKQDRLWIKWIHAYYIKQNNLFTMSIPARLSWALKKIWASRDILIAHQTQQASGEHFSIKKMYQAMRSDQPIVQWKRITCDNKASPKALFITWLLLQGRLSTKSRLCEWGLLEDSTCVLCSNASETSSHLFFECPVSKQLWRMCLQQINMANQPRLLAGDVQAIADVAKKKNPQHQLLLMLYAETVYHIWQQRNQVVFGKDCMSSRHSFKQIIFKVACRCNDVIRQMLIV
ncbi:uncharacterized protein LOC125494120 [Beta vulgaris subsp. vulgaris]|uniref:uncharacterized protein LOC125494120 n=1 Tax=Beta vulgaris subsp. vulgaris TaxID=3555 RepID=UPI002036ED5F|nr:uncharacterized protein LOC125494120 [Beta vulgaris subsp. vulgaris]